MGRSRERAGVVPLGRVPRAPHDRVERDIGLGEALHRAARGDEHLRLSRMAESSVVTRREVDRVDALELLPRQVVGRLRLEPAPERGDRALAVGVDEDRRVGSPRTAARTWTPRGVRSRPVQIPRSSSPTAVKNVLEPASRASCTAATAPPPPGSSQPSAAWTISPAAGTWSTRANSIHSLCPTTATRTP
jgi:hypothetical protein